MSEWTGVLLFRSVQIRIKLCSWKVRRLNWALGPVYMVTGTQDNLPPELPWPRQSVAYFSPKFNQPFTLGMRARLGGRDNSGRRVVSPGGYLTKFSMGRLHPEIQPLTLLYTILAEKVPLLYIFYWKKVPLSHSYFTKSCSHFDVVLNK